MSEYEPVSTIDEDNDYEGIPERFRPPSKEFPFSFILKENLLS